MNVAQRLKLALVTNRNKTVTEVAREVRMSRPAFSNVMNGRADLSIYLAFRIQKKFKIDARSLLIEQLDEKIRHHEMLRR